jgi:Flp pilus assembly protein TadG
MWSSVSSRRNLLADRAGTGTLEFTLVAAILLTAFLAVIELSRYQAAIGALRAVTAEATRAALVDPALSGCTEPELRSAPRAPVLEAERLSLCVTRSTTGGLQQVRVDAGYDFAFVLPVFGTRTRRLTDSSIARF